jgi:hypothetical protein
MIAAIYTHNGTDQRLADLARLLDREEIANGNTAKRPPAKLPMNARRSITRSPGRLAVGVTAGS